MRGFFFHRNMLEYIGIHIELVAYNIFKDISIKKYLLYTIRSAMGIRRVNFLYFFFFFAYQKYILFLQYIQFYNFIQNT